MNFISWKIVFPPNTFLWRYVYIFFLLWPIKGETVKKVLRVVQVDVAPFSRLYDNNPYTAFWILNGSKKMVGLLNKTKNLPSTKPLPPWLWLSTLKAITFFDVALLIKSPPYANGNKSVPQIKNCTFFVTIYIFFLL